MRWVTLLGRIGTVILMIGLALLVASRIPLDTGYSGIRGPISPEEYRIEHSQVYAPQTGFQISVESTDNIRVYLLGVRPVELDNWQTQVVEAYPDLPLMTDRFIMPLVFLREAYPDLDDPQIPDIMDIMWDIAVLDKGLQTYPEIILWDPPPSTTLSHEFISTDELYITVMVANPSSNTVEVATKVTDLTALAAKERVVAAARLLVSIGIALAIPWLVSKKVKKSTF